MKTPTILSLTILALLLGGTSGQSQDQPNSSTPETATEKPGSPFTKKAPPQKTGTPDPKTGANEPDGYDNVGMVVQHIDVKRERWESWLAENPVPLEASTLRRLVETWITEGEAELAETSLIMGKSGQRMKVTSHRKMLYAPEFDPGKGPLPFPAYFDSQDVGTTVEVDPVLGSDRSIDLNTAPTRIAYWGENSPQNSTVGVDPSDVRWPEFFTQRTTLQTVLDAEQWGLLACETPLDGRATDLTLIFARPLVYRVEIANEPPVERKGGMLKFEWIEVDHTTLNRWLMEAKDSGKLVGGDMRRLAAEEGGKLLNTRVIPFRSGTRIKSESIQEIRRATEFIQMEEGILSQPKGIETTSIGITVEVDPVITPDGQAVDINLSPEWAFHFGESVHHRTLINSEWVPDVSTPIFYQMSPTTQVTAPMNIPMLIAAMSPPDEEGWIDSSRKVLIFLTVSY